MVDFLIRPAMGVHFKIADLLSPDRFHAAQALATRLSPGSPESSAFPGLVPQPFRWDAESLRSRWAETIKYGGTGQCDASTSLYLNDPTSSSQSPMRS